MESELVYKVETQGRASLLYKLKRPYFQSPEYNIRFNIEIGL